MRFLGGRRGRRRGWGRRCGWGRGRGWGIRPPRQALEAHPVGTRSHCAHSPFIHRSRAHTCIYARNTHVPHTQAPHRHAPHTQVQHRHAPHTQACTAHTHTFKHTRRSTYTSTADIHTFKHTRRGSINTGGRVAAMGTADSPLLAGGKGRGGDAADGEGGADSSVRGQRCVAQRRM